MIVAVAMLKNLKTGTYHPILSRDAPLPGPFDADKPRRLRSRGHHTSGYESREDAVKSLDELPLAADLIGAVKDLEGDIPWDGEEMPASTAILADEKVVLL